MTARDSKKGPRGPNDQKCLISIEIFDLDRNVQSRRLDFPTKKNRAAVDGSLENFILARNFQSRLKSRSFLIFGPSGVLRRFSSEVAKRWVFPKGWFWRMFPWNENRNEGTFGCSPGTRTGTRVHSDVPPERELERGYVRMFPRNERPERGYVRQNHPFAKPPLCLISISKAQVLPRRVL